MPTGRDVWRIARALEAPPWTFLRYFEPPTPSRDAFRLGDDGRRFRLALAKQPSRRKKMPAPCIFLLRTNGGHHRCSLGALRPESCQAFPSEVVHQVVCLNPVGCTCHDWNLSDVDLDEERARVETRRADHDEYVAVVERWNERFAAGPAGENGDFLSYCAFLLESYDALQAR